MAEAIDNVSVSSGETEEGIRQTVFLLSFDIEDVKYSHPQANIIVWQVVAKVD